MQEKINLDGERKMKIDKNFKNIERLENGDYKIKHDVISDDDIEIDLDDRLKIEGNIISKKSIKTKHNLTVKHVIYAGEGIVAGWGIVAGCGIYAGEGIYAGDGIVAGWGIVAGYGIKAKWINARFNILAGTACNKNVSEEDKTITVEEVKNGTIACGILYLIPKKGIKEMTIAEISKELGYEVKIKEIEDES